MKEVSILFHVELAIAIFVSGFESSLVSLFCLAVSELTVSVINSIRICTKLVNFIDHGRIKLKIIIAFNISEHCSCVLIRCNETVIVFVIVTKTTLGISKNIPASNHQNGTIIFET